MQHKQMNFEQRYALERLLKKKQTRAFIASTIGVDQSTIYRELKRNSRPRGSYNAKYAQMLADERKREGHVKQRFTKKMERYVRDKLENFQWSPEQIVGRARLEGVEMASHERIYQFIWKDKANGGLLYKNLRNSSKKYKKRYGAKDSRGRIPDKTSIDERPEEVEKKERIGDFESDLIIGKNHQGALLSSVDRYSSFVLIEDVGGKRPAMVAKKSINALAPFKKWVRTITNDNGYEFREHKRIAEKLDCKVYFAHPYSSWERGLNEYTNKLIRQYFPKGKSLKQIEQSYIVEVMEKLNNRPRKKLGFKTPKEVFYGYIRQNSKLALDG